MCKVTKKNYTYKYFKPIYLFLRILGAKTTQCLHDTPAYEVSHAADAEYNHVSTWLAIEAHEGEGRTLTLCVGEEHTGTLVDEERTIWLSF